jgi:hypothetical protein
MSLGSKTAPLASAGSGSAPNRQTAHGEIDDVRHLLPTGAIRRWNAKSCEQRRDIASKITWIEGSLQVALLLSSKEWFFQQGLSTLAPSDECLFDRFSASSPASRCGRGSSAKVRLRYFLRQRQPRLPLVPEMLATQKRPWVCIIWIWQAFAI